MQKAAAADQAAASQTEIAYRALLLRQHEQDFQLSSAFDFINVTSDPVSSSAALTRALGLGVSDSELSRPCHSIA